MFLFTLKTFYFNETKNAKNVVSKRSGSLIRVRTILNRKPRLRSRIFCAVVMDREPLHFLRGIVMAEIEWMMGA